MLPRSFGTSLTIVATIILPVLPLAAQGVQSKPLKVFILAGQSNMQGHAKVETLDYLGDDPETASILSEMKNGDGSFRKVEGTWVSYFTHGRGTPNGEGVGQLTAGFGARSDPAADGGRIGPEFTFGIYMQKGLDQPILIIKTAWGGKSLHTDFRPPSAGPYRFNNSEIANLKKAGRDIGEEQAKRAEQSGVYYRLMLDHVKNVLSDPGRVHPEFDETAGYEIGGFVWFQGWNDVVNGGVYPNRGQPGSYDNYSKWLAMFIRDVRKDLETPGMPFVIGVLGTEGPIENIAPRYRKIHAEFRKAMAAPAALPEFKGNVVAVPTAPCWDQELARISRKRTELNGQKRSIESRIKKGEISREDAAAELQAIQDQLDSPADAATWKRGASNAAYHYLGCGKTMALIGKSFAEAMLDLQP